MADDNALGERSECVDSHGSTYNTTPDVSSRWPRCLCGDEEEGYVVIQNLGRNVPAGRGGCDPAINHGKVLHARVSAPVCFLEIQRVSSVTRV